MVIVPIYEPHLDVLCSKEISKQGAIDFSQPEIEEAIEAC